MDYEFSGDVWQWRGPAPFYFVTVPEEDSVDLQAVSAAVTYGWGMIPVRVQIVTDAMASRRLGRRTDDATRGAGRRRAA